MAKSLVPYSRQTITKTDMREVNKVLNSGWLTTGPLVREFEKKVAQLVKAKYAVAVANGTAALHVSCLALSIKPGDEVITVPYTFAASSNCVLYCGGVPVFVDINPETLLIDIKQLEQKVTQKTVGIIGVDFAGRAAPWQELRRIAKKHRLWLVDDAAHSLGAKYNHKPVGTQADVTCFSFHPVKTITTGEGGMVITNKKKLYERLLRLRDHGLKRFKDRRWYYEMRELGYNYRLTDIQSALGLAQLKHIDQFLANRRRLAARYLNRLSGLPYLTLPLDSDESAWHLFPLRIDFNRLKKTKEQLFVWMNKQGITLQVHYIPIHLHPYYRRQFGYKRGDFPIAEIVYEQEVSLPLYPGLTIREQDRVIKWVRDFVEG